jgi:DNA repair protein RadC
MKKELETIYSIVRESKTIYVTDQTAQRYKIDGSNKAFEIFKLLIGEDVELKEIFYIMLLNKANNVLSVQKIGEGSQAGCVIDNRIILKSACDLLASSVIICHNHPSGNLKPSEPDLILTKKIKESLNLVDIKLLDHIIVAPNNKYFSFLDEGVI